MKCSLCNTAEADKSNTHYLTDAIIRTCLNIDGINKREQGYYFGFSNSDPFVEFNFQRDTPVSKIEEELGRAITDEEIEKALGREFAVDNIFCSKCEDLFGEIENPFIKDILPLFRQSDLAGTKKMSFVNKPIVRLFFLLQVWRTAVCDPAFKISPDSHEKLRTLLLNHKKDDVVAVTSFPLVVTYLETRGAEKEYTSNFVGLATSKNYNIILMNDFIIQFFDNRNAIKFYSYYQLNAKSDFSQFVNVNETEFNLKVFKDEKRKRFLATIVFNIKVKPALKFYAGLFYELWFKCFHFPTSVFIQQEFMDKLLGGDTLNILQYSQAYVLNFIRNFVLHKIRTRNIF